ncbi:three-Cys-motif partner protein TcmP [Endozoicomonas sp. ALB032]|uniref:three-Cys-motif partner protein TcmP n=1 Tax=Endozoicomonas sp. ALB032 TaxID=3403082 RepID=UPI003BB5A24B
MPKKNGYDWCNVSPPILEEHSRVKHNVIGEYLRRYISKLTSDPRRDHLKLFIVDGFAGGGVYRSEDGQLLDGSPLVMLKTTREMEKQVQESRTKDFRIQDQYYFIEKSPAANRSLAHVLDQHGLQQDKDHFWQINGSFSTKLPDVIRDIKRQAPRSKNHRCIFLLDQYGYKDVPMQDLYKIRTEIPGAEVILTFSTDSVINYYSSKPAFVQAMKNIGLQAIFETEFQSQLREGNYSRTVMEQILHHLICRKSGFKHFTSFFIRSPKSNRSYWLMHLSNHFIARDEMCNTHWQYDNYFVHYGGPGLNATANLIPSLMLGYDPKKGHGDFQLPIEFAFDDHASLRTHQSLLADLPKRLSTDQPLSLELLFSETCNNSPANLQQYKDALYTLLAGKELELIGETGKVRNPRSGKGIDLRDKIVLPKQIGLF